MFTTIKLKSSCSKTVVKIGKLKKIIIFNYGSLLEYRIDLKNFQKVIVKKNFEIIRLKIETGVIKEIEKSGDPLLKIINKRFSNHTFFNSLYLKSKKLNKFIFFTNTGFFRFLSVTESYLTNKSGKLDIMRRSILYDFLNLKWDYNGM